jgi:hypothetical protein
MRYCCRLAIAVILAGLIIACSSDDEEEPATNVAQPTNVPASAELIERETVVGASTDGGRLAELTCADGIVSIITSNRAIYAELPCDRFVTPEIVERFVDAAVDVTVRPGEPEGKLIIRSRDGASIEFTTGHAWIDDR